MLVSAAAAEWGVDARNCKVVNGVDRLAAAARS